MRFDKRNNRLAFICDEQFLEVASSTVPLEAPDELDSEVEAAVLLILKAFPGAVARKPRPMPRRWNEIVVTKVDPYVPTAMFEALALTEKDGRTKALRAAVRAGNPRVRSQL